MDRFLEREGTRIWTTSNGQGVPTIFCNGGPGCDDYLGPVANLIPKGQYFEIAGAQHCPWMTHPDELEKHIREAIVFMANPATSG